MAQGKEFTLTAKRITEALTMLSNQHTLTSLAHHFGVHRATLTEKLVDAGIDHSAVRNAGTANLRALTFMRINSIPDADK